MTNNLPELTGPVSIESYAENLNAKLQVADILLKSGMAPASYKSREAILGAVLYGRELGFSPIRALHAINVIQGKPTLSAEGLKALAIQHGAKIQTIEWTEQVCTLKCTRGDWTEECTFTMKDAALQGLSGKDNWKKMPKAMLYARCVSTIVRNMFADVIGGLYSAEEMRDAAPTVREFKRPKEIMFPMVDESTGEIVDDDLPESFGPKKITIAEMKAFVDACNWEAIGGHKIVTRCTIQGQTIREALKTHEELIKQNIENFEAVDQMALDAYAIILAEEKMNG